MEFKGAFYRTYDNWLEFSIDLGDYYVFSKKYNTSLEANNLDQQLDALVEEYSQEYCDQIENLISKYGLWEFDLY